MGTCKPVYGMWAKHIIQNTEHPRVQLLVMVIDIIHVTQIMCTFIKLPRCPTGFKVYLVLYQLVKHLYYFLMQFSFSATHF